MLGMAPTVATDLNTTQDTITGMNIELDIWSSDNANLWKTKVMYVAVPQDISHQKTCTLYFICKICISCP